MPDQPDRCPMCGDDADLISDTYHACHECGLTYDYWPRIAELKAKLADAEHVISNGIAFAFNMRPDDQDSPACDTLDEELGRTNQSIKRLAAAAEADCEGCKVWVAALYEFIDAVGPRRGKSIPEDFEHAMIAMRRLAAIRDEVLRWREMCELEGPGTVQEIWAQEEFIMDLARQEAERNVGPRTQPEAPAE